MNKLDNNKVLMQVLDNVLVQKYQMLVVDGVEDFNVSLNRDFELTTESLASSLELLHLLKQSGYALTKESLVYYLTELSMEGRRDVADRLVSSINHDLFKVSGEVFFKDFPNFNNKDAWQLHQLLHYITYSYVSESGKEDVSIYTPQFSGDEDIEGYFEELSKFYAKLDLEGYDTFVKESNLKLIKFVNESEYVKGYTYAKNLINSKTSLSTDNINDLVDLIDVIEELSLEDREGLLPDRIERKEIMAYVVSTLIHNGYTLTSFKKYIQTSTDILRVIDVQGGGDGTLDKGVSLPKFNRPLRSAIMELLNSINPYIASEDMFRNKKVWKGLLKLIHPFESRYDKFNQSQKSFELFAKGDKSHTFATRSKEMEKSKDYLGLAELLSQRPGELARKMDLILRNIDDNDGLKVLNLFKDNVNEVSSLILYQLLSHIKNNTSIRKVETSKGFYYREQEALKNTNTFSKYILEGIIKDELGRRYQDKEDLGKVYLDPKLKQFNIPISQRTSSLSSNLMTRGSKVSLNLKDVLRVFTYWKNSENTMIDLDLSSVLLSESFEYKGKVYFGYQRMKGASHSGDIRNAPKGANEFIDLNISELKSNGVRYVVMYVNVFTGLTFNNFDCKAGFLNLTNEDTNLVFNPYGEVKFKGEEIDMLMDINSNHNATVPLVVDIEKGLLYWLDETVAKVDGLYASSVSNVREDLKEMVMYAINNEYISIYDLLDMHIKNRNGVEVFDKEYADVVFEQSKENLLDLVSIMSEYF